MSEELKRSVRSGKCYLYLLIGSIAAMYLARGIGSKLSLPVLMTLVIYPVYALDLSQGRRNLAVCHTLFWAFVSSVLMIYFVRQDAAHMAKRVFRGVSYRDNMFQWILTGEGSEGNIRLFLPEHIKHFAIFCVSSFVTAGVWGLAFGAVLLNYMNFYVGSLSLKAHPPFLVFLFGWPLWSYLRVIGFVLCGITLSEPLLSQLIRFRPDFRRSSRYFIFGLVLILADIFLKAALAPFWRGLLRRIVSL